MVHLLLRRLALRVLLEVHARVECHAHKRHERAHHALRGHAIIENEHSHDDDADRLEESQHRVRDWAERAVDGYRAPVDAKGEADGRD